MSHKLDEPTSVLGVSTELHVRDGIERAKEGRTTLLVTHRLATVIHADRLLVLDRGRIAEMGTPQELLAGEGVFTRSIRRNGWISMGEVKVSADAADRAHLHITIDDHIY